MSRDVRLQISKPGENVFTTANKNLVYSSAYWLLTLPEMYQEGKRWQN